jgi:hypothetical protein
MRTRRLCGSLVVALLLVARVAAQAPLQQKVMITEVCPYGTEAGEITNYDIVPTDLTGYRVSGSSTTRRTPRRR